MKGKYESFLSEVRNNYKNTHSVYDVEEGSLLLQIPVKVNSTWNLLQVLIQKDMWKITHDINSKKVEDYAQVTNRNGKILLELVFLWEKHIGKVPRVLR